MILFFENGRLGNQLFQYFGLTKYFTNDKLVIFGCEALERCFDSLDALFIPKSLLNRLIPFNIMKRTAYFLASIQILGSITEDLHSYDFNLNVRRGLIFNIYVAQDLFFQHFDVLNKIQITTHFRPYLVKAAHSWFRRKQLNINSSSLVFVHIRRGDYLNWPTKESPAVLDLAWYDRAMGLMRQKIKNPIFILISDDLYYLRDIFTQTDDLIISDNSPEIDLAIMSFCCSGILSASSFACLGAIYARSRKELPRIFLGPNYWAGHRSKNWFPSRFYCSWITYID